MPTVTDQYAIALDLGGTALRGGIVSSTGKLSMFAAVDTAPDRSVTSVMQQVVTLIERLSADAKDQGINPSAVGLALPGFLALKEQTIHFSPNFPSWSDVPIGAWLRKSIALPFTLLNDGNAQALGEWWCGAAHGRRNAIVLTLGTGVGGGVIVDNRLLEGCNGIGGEIGHMTVLPNGPLCGCGNRGCLESLISGTALQRESGKSVALLAKEAKAGSLEAQHHFDQMGYHLGIALSSLVFIFQPEVAIVSGKLSRSFDLFSPAMRKEMQDRLHHHPTGALDVVASTLVDQAGLLGVAWQALKTIA